MGYLTTNDDFQHNVAPWLQACFGPEIAADKTERNHRFLEEALEAVQAGGCSASEAHQLVDYVFGRPVGELKQEVGGVMVTLAALCLANGIDMHREGRIELARVWTKVDAIRAKQAAKPKHSPLPQATETAGIMELIDAYAEARHRCGSGAYNMPTVAARQAVERALAARHEDIDATYEKAMLEKDHREEFVATSRDGENFTDTSIGELLDDHGVVGQKIYVGTGVKRTASYFLPDPDTIEDEMADAAGEEGGEFSAGYPNLSEDAKKAMAVALHNWAKEHVSDPTFFTVIDSAEHVVTQQDLDQR